MSDVGSSGVALAEVPGRGRVALPLHFPGLILDTEVGDPHPMAIGFGKGKSAFPGLNLLPVQKQSFHTEAHRDLPRVATIVVGDQSGKLPRSELSLWVQVCLSVVLFQVRLLNSKLNISYSCYRTFSIHIHLLNLSEDDRSSTK